MRVLLVWGFYSWNYSKSNKIDHKYSLSVFNARPDAKCLQSQNQLSTFGFWHLIVTYFTIPVIQPLKNTKNIYFVGTIQQGLDGTLTKEETTGVDFAILTLCDHVVVSHGTFGMWAAFLASNENTHIMATPLDSNNQTIFIEEVKEVRKANLKNFIFMDDTWIKI